MYVWNSGTPGRRTWSTYATYEGRCRVAQYRDMKLSERTCDQRTQDARGRSAPCVDLLRGAFCLGRRPLLFGLSEGIEVEES